MPETFIDMWWSVNSVGVGFTSMKVDILYAHSVEVHLVAVIAIVSLPLLL